MPEREKGATEVSVLMGMDALRICMGMQPVNYQAAQVTRWMEIMLEEMQRDAGEVDDVLHP